MKVVSSHQMSHIESLAYRDGASETDFMEEAGSGIALVVHDYAELHDIDRIAILLCGKGNNAGDAYVAGQHLLHLDYKVFAIQVHPITECTPLCRQNYERFLHEGGYLADSLQGLTSSGIIIDGLFGTGFKGRVENPYKALIEEANQSALPIIAIDIPSGLNGETGVVQDVAIIATETAFLGLPKTGFFLADGWNHVGKLRYVDFGLPLEYVEESEFDLIMASPEILKPLLPPIKRNRNKYEAGYVVGLAGSPGMAGAAILSSTSALRGGAGIVRLLHPEGMQVEFAFSPYEIIKHPYQYENIEEILVHLNRASATFIGPGLGRSQKVRSLLRVLLPQLQKPCVIDADALSILAEEEDIPLPKQTIMTPHLGEMMRLLKLTNRPTLDMEFLVNCQNFAIQKDITLILKGGPSFIIHPNAPITVNPTGDPGMATAGSGDVLTGLIAALLSQGVLPKDAATLAVFLHGSAGEYSSEEMTSYALNASDIVYRFPEAFMSLINTKPYGNLNL